MDQGRASEEPVREIWRSYDPIVLTPGSIRCFLGLLTRADPTLINYVRLTRKGNDPDLLHPPERILDERNPSGAPMFAVSLGGLAENRWLDVRLWPASATVVIRSQGIDNTVAERFTHEVRNEIKNIRAFHWPIRRYLSLISNRFTSPRSVVILAVLWSLLLLSTLINSWRKDREQNEPLERLAAKIEALSRSPGADKLPEYREAAENIKVARDVAPSNFLRSIRSLVVGAVMGLLLLVVLRRLFPPIVFAIGEGEKRYDLLVRWRWYALALLLPSGLVARFLF